MNLAMSRRTQQQLWFAGAVRNKYSVLSLAGPLCAGRPFDVQNRCPQDVQMTTAGKRRTPSELDVLPTEFFFSGEYDWLSSFFHLAIYLHSPFAKRNVKHFASKYAAIGSLSFAPPKGATIFFEPPV